MVGNNLSMYKNHLQMNNVRPVQNVTSSSNVNVVKEDANRRVLEFKSMPTMSKLTSTQIEPTGTYNKNGKLGLISDKVIVFVHPSAFLRDKLVPSYKVV